MQKDMELILDIFWERHKSFTEWKQIMCAVFLAFLCAGLYNYVDAHPVYVKDSAEKPAALTDYTWNMASLIDLPTLPKEDTNKDKTETFLDIVPEEMNYAVNTDGFDGLEETGKTGNEKAAAEKKTGVKTTDKRFKYVQEAAPEHFMPATVTDILNRNGNDTGSIAGSLNDIINRPGTIGDREDSGDKPAGDEEKDADRTDNKPDGGLEHIAGFLINGKGHVAGYTDTSVFMRNHLVVLPVHGMCTGIERGALKGLEADIYEIYIPANISYIAPGAFDDFLNLLYIEAAAGNPEFYSRNGILYYKSGEVAAYPAGLKE